MGSLPFLTGLLGVSGFYYATNILSNNLAFFIEIFSYFFSGDVYLLFT